MRIGTALAATALAATALLGASGTAFAHDHDDDHGFSSSGLVGNFSMVGGSDGVVDANVDGFHKEGMFGDFH
ncbi:hypothetical protein ACFYZ9_39040 [Streptomyces sp. NPDC001691]|uniref:hypothetical protein n=1 Tax=unclassified Streptomyces TaxID=2593676 RepID=UPI000DEAEB20|nr:hypothetical protein [Streptomyces sp. SDr-06]RCH67508.1 hypothetical protein DT019_18065 [Streptomyces sp. SDr-06]